MISEKIKTDIQRFATFFESLPPVTTRKYETSITDWSIEYAQENKEMLYMLVRNDHMISSENELSIRFTAYVALCIYLRRMKNISEYKLLIEEYGNDFTSFALYPHFCSMMYKELRTPESFISAIHHAEQAVDLLPEHEGVLHNFAETVVVAMEEGITLDSSYLDKAEKELNKAIRLSKYAKFYCTRGRLLALKKEYKAATESILKAIDMEDSTKSDYVLRINDYQHHLANLRSEQLNNKLQEYITELTGSKEKLEKSLQEVKTKNLEMLGFFVAIITFTIGSFNFVNQDSMMDSATLLLILTGCMVIGYVAFSILFSANRQKVMRVSAASGVGLFMIAVGFAIHFLM